MRNIYAGLTLLFLCLPGRAQTAPVVPRLNGVINVGDVKEVILEDPPTGRPPGNVYILSEGQRDGNLAVVQIVPESGTAILHIHTDQNSLTVTNQLAAAKGSGEGMVFDNVSLPCVLKLYSDFSNRTLLLSPRLPSLRFTMTAPATNAAVAALALKSALNQKNVATIPDGEKFVMVVPQDEAALVKPCSSQVKASNPSESEVMQRGMVDFLDAHPIQVAELYAELRGRKLDPTAPLPHTVGFIRLYSQTPLNRAEVAYAMETVLGWAGVEMVPSGKDLMKAVPVGEANR